MCVAETGRHAYCGKECCCCVSFVHTHAHTHTHTDRNTHTHTHTETHTHTHTHTHTCLRHKQGSNGQCLHTYTTCCRNKESVVTLPVALVLFSLDSVLIAHARSRPCVFFYPHMCGRSRDPVANDGAHTHVCFRSTESVWRQQRTRDPWRVVAGANTCVLQLCYRHKECAWSVIRLLWLFRLRTVV